MKSRDDLNRVLSESIRHMEAPAPPPGYFDEIGARIGQTPQVDPDRDACTTEEQSSETSQLVRAASAGDAEAWAALVERFSGLLWAITRSYGLNLTDAVDVSQTVWLTLAQKLGLLREPVALGAWLVTVTRNECLRRTRETSGIADVTEAGLLDDEPGHASSQAFERLPTRCRSLMRLLQVKPPLSYAEIAATLDVPIGSIGPMRRRCLELLTRFDFEDELKFVIFSKIQEQVPAALREKFSEILGVDSPNKLDATPEPAS